MASTSDFKNGLILRMKESLWKIVEFQHVKPGKGAAFVRSKLKILQQVRLWKIHLELEKKLKL